MKVLVIDPSGKIPLYDYSLCNALCKEDLELTFLSPCTKHQADTYDVSYRFKKLVKVPDGWNAAAQKILKPLIGLINYLYVIGIIGKRQYDVIHFQWLPFLEYFSIEWWFLSVYKTISPRSKFVLTQHNLYPHNSSLEAKKLYNKRMQAVKNKFDLFILHTESSKEAFCKEFKVKENKVSVVYHGVFHPNTMPIRKSALIPKRILMFGIQSFYKGTDILIDAVDLLSEDIRAKINVTIAGGTEDHLLIDKLPLAKKNGITWLPRYIEDDELNQLIADSDVLVLPYRAISQSGVLLQSLPYKKHLLVSDLPSFRETLKGYPEDCFFRAGSSESLAKSITDYINDNVDFQKEKMANQYLIELYSWNMSAKKTVELYKRLFD